MSPTPEQIETGPARAKRILLLAHGAGQGMDAPFMETIADGVAGHGILVVRFNFPYMQRARVEGRRRPPDRASVLQDCFRGQIEALAPKPGSRKRLVIGGKSMGGRMASLLADESGVAGLVCLGYPFHPPGKPDRLRTEHLEGLKTPALFCQGERDPFGKREEVGSYKLSRRIRMHWLPDGEHSFKPRKASGHTVEENLASTVEAIADFVESVCP